jgi:hypothetical protein
VLTENHSRAKILGTQPQGFGRGIDMKKPITGLAIVLAAMCMGATSQAQPASTGPAWTIQQMYQSCKSQVATDQIECISYLRGLADAMDAVQSFRAEAKTPDVRDAMSPLAACIDQVSGGQLEQVFVNWAEANPTMWQERRGYALAALRKAWPCPN